MHFPRNTGGRLVVSGDPTQHGAVQLGRPFQMLIDTRVLEGCSQAYGADNLVLLFRIGSFNLSDFRHAHSASKTHPVRQVGCSDGYGEFPGLRPAFRNWRDMPHLANCFLPRFF